MISSQMYLHNRHTTYMYNYVRVTQKTFINKNRITAKICVRFTQKLGYIRLSRPICRRHLQSFMSVPQKRFV